MFHRLIAFFDRHCSHLDATAKEELARHLEETFLADFLAEIIQESETILAIDPRQSVRAILETAARVIVSSLGAAAATIRLLEPHSFRMLNFGAYGMDDASRDAAIPAANSIAGKVVRQRRAVAVPSILAEPLYQNKEIVHRHGFHSLLAVPLVIPSFDAGRDDLLGSLQIYYREDQRPFHRLEILRAEMLARRVSHVLARKRILALYDLNTRKEKIVDTIFVKLSKHEPIKLREIFVMLLNELEEILQLQGCSLFTITPDNRHIFLEAAQPPELSYHVPGHLYTIAHHPYFAAVLDPPVSQGGHLDSGSERLDDHHLLIRDPATSTLLSEELRAFALANRITSMLFIPIRVGGEVRHLLLLLARGNRQAFSDDDIDILAFFGKEIMKAAKLEALADTLHDIKNPAVAIAGLAGRLQRMVTNKELEPLRERLAEYAAVLAREANRIQDLALTRAGEDRAETLDLGEIARRRYALNRAVIQQQQLTGIQVAEPVILPGCWVHCPRTGLERVVDNLLHNATAALAEDGGRLALEVGRSSSHVFLVIRNSGEIPPAHLTAIQAGTVTGRGLEIVRRFATLNHGRLAITCEGGETVVRLELPAASPPREPAG